MSHRSLDEKLADLLGGADDLPSMPAAAVEVLRLTQDDSSTLDDIAAAIAMDPALAGKVLRVANSSLFSRGTPVATLQRAALVLGMKTVKLLSLSFSLIGALPMSGDGPFDLREYWRRSVVKAVAARAMAARLGSLYADEAFLCGMLSGIGQLVLGHCARAVYAPVLEKAKGNWPDQALEQEVLGYDGFDVGGTLLRSWSLPYEISESIACSRNPDEIADQASSAVCELVHLIHFARLCEVLVCEKGASGTMDDLRRVADEYFEMDQVQLEELLRQLSDGIAETADMLELRMQTVAMDEVLHQAQTQLAKETLGMASEMAEVKERAVQLEHSNLVLQNRAETDGLTGLPNRACFDEFLARCLDRQGQPGHEGMGLLMVDVDHFKEFNDAYGHQTGDVVLKQVAEVMSGVMREGALVARYGGEEFAAVLPRVNGEGLQIAAERIRAAVQDARRKVDGKVLSVTVSIGGAWTDEDQPPTPDDLIQGADRCLYVAKATGRNKTMVLPASEACAAGR